MRNRVELHCHTKMSKMEGMADTRGLLRKAKAMGMPAIAITDNGSVQSFAEAYDAWERAAHANNNMSLSGIVSPRINDAPSKVLFGVEASIVDDIKYPKSRTNPNVFESLRGYKIIIIVANPNGFKNLYEIISKYRFRTHRNDIRVLKSELEQRRDGLIVGSCAQGGEVNLASICGESDERMKEESSFYDFVEVEPVRNYLWYLKADKAYSDLSCEDVKGHIRRIIRVCNENSIPVIASSNVYYIEKDEVDAFSVLRYKRGYREPKSWRRKLWKAEHHLMTTEEMLEKFEFLGHEMAETIVIDNPNSLVEGIDTLNPIPSKREIPVYPDADNVLERLCYEKAYELYGESLPDAVSERIEYELAGIRKAGYSSLYMIAYELVKGSHDAGYIVGSRGSSGSSLLSYLLEITEVNPLPPHYICKKCGYTNFNVSKIGEYQYGNIGSDLPDEKCPVCGCDLLKDGYGIPVETFLGLYLDKEPDFDFNFSGIYQETAKDKLAEIKGVGSIFHVGTICRISEEDALEYVREYYKELDNGERHKPVEDVAKTLVGIKKEDELSSDRLIVLGEGDDIYRYTPVISPEFDDEFCTQKEYCDFDSDLLKMDILKHDDPTIMKLLYDSTGVNPLDIPLDDKEVMSLFVNTDALGIEPDQIGGIKIGTIGVNEFKSEIAQNIIEKARPRSISDLVRVSGLCHGTDTWFNNAEYLIEEGKTLSECITNRDDIMMYLIDMGIETKTAFRIMESVRNGRVAANRENHWQEWKSEMIEAGVPDWYTESCEKIKYLFPKAHLSSYTLTAWRLLYYKLHYPDAFYCIWLKFAKVVDIDFVNKGYEHAKYVHESLKYDRENGIMNKYVFFNEVLVVLEMFARGANVNNISIY